MRQWIAWIALRHAEATDGPVGWRLTTQEMMFAERVVCVARPAAAVERGARVITPSQRCLLEHSAIVLPHAARFAEQLRRTAPHDANKLTRGLLPKEGG